jgi:hypothetical protein
LEVDVANSESLVGAIDRLEDHSDLVEAAEIVHRVDSITVDSNEISVVALDGDGIYAEIGDAEQLSAIPIAEVDPAHGPEPAEALSEAPLTPDIKGDFDQDVGVYEEDPVDEFDEVGAMKREQLESLTLNIGYVAQVDEDDADFNANRDDSILDEEFLSEIDPAYSETDADSGPTLADIEEAFRLVSPPEHYIPLKENQRLVCIGDVHGDFKAFEKSLEIAGVYERVADPYSDDNLGAVEGDPHIKWKGGDTILVQIGDVLDRGYEELACFYLLTELSRKAAAAGGHVIVLFGNHEVMNAIGLFHYAYNDMEYENLIGSVLDRDGRSAPSNLKKEVEQADVNDDSVSAELEHLFNHRKNLPTRGEFRSD